ncbi:hypothetical protein SDC9_191945 [bioreactor metagenome]|uniref:Uncharacterized protein n=1 Tax=bioreactor metagenome TaxID=1076179 RepID=A0A645HZN0_9ZZZZ
MRPSGASAACSSTAFAGRCSTRAASHCPETRLAASISSWMPCRAPCSQRPTRTAQRLPAKPVRTRLMRVCRRSGRIALTVRRSGSARRASRRVAPPARRRFRAASRRYQPGRRRWRKTGFRPARRPSRSACRRRCRPARRPPSRRPGGPRR